MTPDQRAIVDSAMLDENFGDLETRKMLQAMSAGTTRTQNRQRLDLARRSQESSYNLGKEGLALSRERLALNTQANTAMQKIRRKGFEFQKSQIPISTALGVANVGLSGYTGYQDMIQKKKLAQDYSDMAGLVRRY